MDVIRKKIKDLEFRKRQVVDFLDNLENKLEKNKISKEEYDFLVYKQLNGEDKKGYIRKINEHITELEENHDELKRRHLDSKSRALGMAFVLLICLVLSSMFFMNYSGITGYLSYTGEESFNMAVDEMFYETTNYSLNITNITSLKISGYFTGKVKVFLSYNNAKYLVLNSEPHKVNEYSNLITGYVTGDNITLNDSGNESLAGETEENVSDEEETVIENITEKITEEINKNTTQNVTSDKTTNPDNLSENITITETDNLTLNITTNITGNITENITDNISINISGNITENITINETENITFNATQNITINITENITENISVNVTGNINDNITYDETPDENITINETDNISVNITDNITINITENITENISVNLTENISLNISENITENITLNITENITLNITENLTKYFFNEKCVETCSFSLKQGNMTLLIEFYDNKSSLFLSNISYTKPVPNKPPMLLKNISDIYLDEKNNYSIELNLDDYFNDTDELLYDLFYVEHIDYSLNKSVLGLNSSPKYNGSYETYVYATDGESLVESNRFKIYVGNLKINDSVIIQGKAEIGKPVKWTKIIRLNNNKTNIKFDLPEEASNIKIEKTINKTKKEVLTPQINTISDKKEIKINETTGEIEIHYETEAPQITEENISDNVKRVTVIGPDNLHYKNVTAYTTIPESKKERIRLYRTTNGTRELTQIINYYDENNNSLIDKVEWIVPHLSNQTYEIIIEITKAEHLDENRTFISDIYDEVKFLDSVWSEPIYKYEYIRVTFEKNLTSDNDITLYVRNNQSLNTSIDVYYYNSTEKITGFPIITNEEYYKVFLTGMNGTYDKFDLRIVNYDNITDNLTPYLEFDHIIDPAPNQPVLNYPSHGSTGIELSPTLNITAIDPDGDDMNVSFYGTVPWDISYASYDSISISSQSNGSQGLFISSDGTRLYTIGWFDDKISQYNCTDAWNLSSCSYSGINISTQGTGPTGLFFKSDGTKLYEIGNGGITYQFNCTTAWLLSSCSYNGINVSVQDGTSQGLFFKSDGTKMYEIGDGGNKIYQYTCSNAWTLSSCNYDAVSISTQDDAPKGLFFKSDGKKLYESAYWSGGNIYQYNCTDAWNLSSCSYNGVNISTESSIPADLFFKPDGTRMYEIGNDNNIKQYSFSYNLLNTSNNVANGTDVTYTWTGLSPGIMHLWYVNVTDGTDTTISSIWNFTTSYTPVLKDYDTTPDTAYTTDDLVFNITCTDPDSGDTITGYVQIYNGTNAFGSIHSQTVSNNTEATVYSLGSENILRYETWTGEFWCGDDYSNSSKKNNSVTIQNSLPIPTLNSPGDDSSFVYRTNMTLNVTVTDANNDIMNVSFYEGIPWELPTASYNGVNISAHNLGVTGLFFSSNGTKLYEISSYITDNIYQYSCNDAWNLSSCSYDSVSITPKDSSPTSLFFSSNGTKLYEMGDSNNLIYQYNCTTAWDLSSCSYSGINISTQDTQPSGLFFKPDGTRLYEIGEGGGNGIYQYLCSDAWNLSSCIYNTSISVEDSDSSGLSFKSDGTKLYEIGYDGDKIYQYNCSTAWLLSSCSYNGINISIQDSDPEDLFFKSDGTKLYEIGSTGPNIYQYDLVELLNTSTNVVNNSDATYIWIGLSNQTYDWFVDITDDINTTRSSIWNFTIETNNLPSPTLNYPLDNSTEIELSPTLNVTVTDADDHIMDVSIYGTDSWNLLSAYYDGVSISTQDGYSQGLFFKPDGKMLYEIGRGSDQIYQYICSNAWDLSSCSFDNINISTQDGTPTDLFFKPDGTKLYEIGNGGDKIYQYSCNDAWGLSSCSYNGINISTQDLNPYGLSFKSDGTKLYEVGDYIYQYTCSDAWNLSSCSYLGINISTQDSSPTDLFFISNGTKLYEIDSGSDKIYQYNCSTAWDLSSCSYSGINISTQDDGPNDLFFSSDGTKLYEIGEDGDKIYQYSLFDLLNTSTNVAHNSDVTHIWSGLSPGTTYQWYVNITDGYDTTQSSRWSFTTYNDLPNITLNNPTDNSTLTYRTSVSLNITVTDNDNHTMNISFYNGSRLPWDISTAYYTGVNISTMGDGATGMFFSPDGLRLYQTARYIYSAEEKIYQYTCSDAWNLSTCSYEGINIVTQDNQSSGLFFSSDGKKLYEIGRSRDKIFQYTCNIPWSLSTCSYDAVSISTQDISPRGLSFKSDGTKLYEIGYDGDKIYQYNCNTPWSLSTCSYNDVDIPTQTGYSQDLFFKKDGTKLYEVGSSNIYEYNCTSAWDLSTCNYTGVNIGILGALGLFFKPDGTKLYGVGNDEIFQYSLVELLNTSTNVVNNSDVTYTWTGLSDKTYKWFIDVTDGINTTRSSVWNFTINSNNVPNAILNYPGNGSRLSYNTSVNLNVTAIDADNHTLNITFYNASDDSVICTQASIENNTAVNCSWSGLTSGLYQWYVNVTDSYAVTKSSTWNFTINSKPAITLRYPSDDSTEIGLSPTLNVTVIDADGDNTNVSLYQAVPWDLSYAFYNNVTFTHQQYVSTDISFSSDGTNLYILEYYIYQYNCSSPWDISSCSYNGVYFDSGINPEGMFFKSDGLKLYEIENNDDKIYQHNCTDAWNLSSCSDSGINISTQDDGSDDLFFSSNGSKLYEIGSDGDKIYQYNCSTAWLLSSCSYSGINISTQDINPNSLYFSSDGTKLYDLSYNGSTSRIYQYNCSTAWLLSSCSYTGRNASTQAPFATGLFFKPDGTKLYEIGYGDKIYEYSLGTLLNKSTNVANNSDVTWTWNGLSSQTTYYWFARAIEDYDIIYSPTWNFTTFNYAPEITLNNPPDDSSFAYRPNITLNVTVTDGEGDMMNVSFYQGIPLDLSNSSYDSISISTQDGVPQGLFFKPDGTKIYEIGDSSNRIYQYSCSNNWNLSSCSYDTIYISTQDSAPTGLSFNSDGKKLYVIGDSSNRIRQYTCSNAWNLSSCSYSGIYISTQDTAPKDLFFKSDGTRLYEIGDNSNRIYQYSCSNNWNLSSCSYDSVFISSQDSAPTGLYFNSDGKKLYVIGDSSNRIYQFTCSNAWTLSSCSYDTIYITTQDTNPSGLFLKPDGTKMYEIGYNSDDIHQYSLGTLLNTSTNVANNSDVTYTWTGLVDKSYGWFVIVTDGEDVGYSSSWNFTIEPNNVPNITLNYPSDGSTEISVSPTLNITVSDVENHTMDVFFYNNATGSQIYNQTNVANNSIINYTWSGLSLGTTYYWYVNVTDGYNTTQSSVWDFTTMSDTPIITLNAPQDNSSLSYRTSATLNVSVKNIDGDIMNVSFYNGSGTTSTNWWNSSWIKRKDINITNVGSSTLTNFPVYLNISNENEMQNDYGDLRFISGSCNSTGGSELDYEVEYYNSSKADVWVRIPSLTTGINSICMYYNNSGASDGENPSGVWDSNYMGVWHLNQNPSTAGTNGIIDSTSNSNNGTDTGNMDSNDLVLSRIGYGLDFDGTDDYINISDDSSLDLAGFTIEAWIYPHDKDDWRTITAKGAANDEFNWYYVLYANNSEIRNGWTSYNAISSSPLYTENTEWFYVNAIADTSAGELRLYMNGAEHSYSENDWGGNSVNNNNPVLIGANEPWGEYFGGIIDELRISNISRTDDWLNQTYQMVVNQNSFISFGNEESYEGILLNTTTNVANNSDVSWTWTGLSPGSTYEWYVVAVDNDGTTQSSIWNFTISGTNNAPNVTLNYPHDNSTGISTSPTLNITVSDVENHTMNVSFYNGSCSGSTNWWNSSWTLRKNINITNVGSSTLNNFPVYLNISNENEMQNDYGDLRFISGSCNSSGGSELDYEVEYYNSSKSDVWVKIPSLTTGISSICMYYNNSAASDGENPTGVWSSDYRGVWHMTEVNAVDSTSYENNGTQSGGVTFTSSGLIDGANDFDGNDNYINLDNDASLDITGEITLSAWVKHESGTGTYDTVIGLSTSGDAPRYYITTSNDLMYVRFETDNNDLSLTSSGTIDNSGNVWTYTTVRYNGSRVQGYINGQLDSGLNASATGAIKTGSADDYIGCWGTHYFNGVIDEVRISNISRTDDWLNQTYQIVANQNSYVSFGNEEGYEGSGILLNTTTNIASGSDVSWTWSGLSSGATYEWCVEVTDGYTTTTSPTWNFTVISCGSDISSDITLYEDLNCDGSALTIVSNNITLDCNNHFINQTGSDNTGSIGINFSGVDNVTLKNCEIKNFEEGVYLYSSADENNLTDNVFNGNNYSIYILNSGDNYFYDSDVSNSTNADVYANSSSSENNYFINVTHDKADILVYGSANLTFKWYLDAHTQRKSASNLADVTVTAWDKNNNQHFSDNTDVLGDLSKKIVPEYYQTSAGKTYYNNYTINASKAGYTTNSTVENITGNTELTFSLNDIPSISSQISFSNCSVGHCFNATASVDDEDGHDDVISSDVSISSGSCQNISWTGSVNTKTVIYNCTGTPYAEAEVIINFTDATGETVATNPANNTFPNNAPTTPTQNLPKNNSISLDDSQVVLNCFDSSDPDSDTVYYIFYGDNSTGSTYLTNNTQGEYIWNGLNNGTTYYWKCQAYDGYDYSSNTTVWQFRENAKPTQITPILNSSSGNNLTTDNLTCYNQSTNDADNDNVTNIYNWYKNGNSITVLNMPFDSNVSSNNTNAIKDYTNYENNGTLGGGNNSRKPTWTSSGKIGGAYSFDGEDDYIELPDNLITIGDSFSVSLWVNLNSDSSSDRVFSLRGDMNFILRVLSDGTLQIYSNNWHSVGSISHNEWRHITTVFNGTSFSSYIDGTFNNSYDEVPNSNSATNVIGIAGWDLNTDPTNGTIDQVKIYNYSLSQEQIYQIYLEENNSISSSTIVSNETTPGDTWNCTVTPNDGLEDGTTLWSNSLSVTTTDPPNITWTVPDTSNTSVFNSSSFTQNITFTDEYLKEYNCTIYNDSGLTNPVWTIETDISGNTNYIENSTIDISSWHGYYYENCSVSDI